MFVLLQGWLSPSEYAKDSIVKTEVPERERERERESRVPQS